MQPLGGARPLDLDDELAQRGLQLAPVLRQLPIHLTLALPVAGLAIGEVAALQIAALIQQAIDFGKGKQPHRPTLHIFGDGNESTEQSGVMIGNGGGELPVTDRVKEEAGLVSVQGGVEIALLAQGIAATAGRNTALDAPAFDPGGPPTARPRAIAPAHDPQPAGCPATRTRRTSPLAGRGAKADVEQRN